MWDVIADDAAGESSLWADSLLPDGERKPEAVFSRLVPEELRIGVETIYEGYLVHYGRSRLFAPPDDESALLLGDYLYAHGLVRVAETGNVAAVADLAELISLCAQARAERRDGDGAAWVATTALIGTGGLDEGRRTLRLGGDHAVLESDARRAAGDEAVESRVGDARRPRRVKSRARWPLRSPDSSRRPPQKKAATSSSRCSWSGSSSLP